VVSGQWIVASGRWLGVRVRQGARSQGAYPPSAKAGNWRKAKTTRMSSTFFIYPPPSARQLELAEWVKFLEKNVGSWLVGAPIGGEGQQGPKRTTDYTDDTVEGGLAGSQ
jgi:hypothetical protein